METQLTGFIDDLKKQVQSNPNLKNYDEAATKQGIILPILHHLDWNAFDVNEVYPEYNLDGKKVDYPLRTGDVNRVFVEAKRTGEDLDNHQEQLLTYSFKEGVELAILTNGITWWFYLPLKKGNWEQRKFYTIHIPQQETEDVVGNFTKFLQKDQVHSGQVLKSAEDVHKSQTRLNTLNDTIPQAWNKLLLEPDELLVDLIAEETEALCGFKPDEKVIRDFIQKYRDQFAVQEDAATPPAVRKPRTHKEKKGIVKKAKPTRRTAAKQVQPHPDKSSIDRVNLKSELMKCIIRKLQTRGGGGLKREVQQEVYEEFKEIFESPFYRQKTKVGEVKWKNEVAWAKEKAKKEGLIKWPKNSGRGYWELTDKGVKWKG